MRVGAVQAQVQWFACAWRGWRACSGAYMRTTHHVRHCCAQNADHLAHGSPLSAFFAEVVCSLAATPPPVGSWPTPNGGNGVIRGVTRRRHAASHLLMLQNPHRRRCGRYCEADEIGEDYQAWPRRGVAGDERPVIGDMDGAERTQDSPNKNRAGPLRYKTRPADPFSPDLRDKTLPARSKSPYLGRFARAGRTLYRCHQQEAVRGERCTEYKSETGLAITVHQAPPVWRARRAWLRCRGRWRGLVGLFTATRPHWCGGRRRDRRAWLRCPWAVAGPGRASRRRAERSSRRGRLAGGPPPTGTQSSPARTQRGARSAAAPRAPHSRVSVAHRLSWMLRPGTASISSRV